MPDDEYVPGAASDYGLGNLGRTASSDPGYQVGQVIDTGVNYLVFLGYDQFGQPQFQSVSRSAAGSGGGGGGGAVGDPQLGQRQAFESQQSDLQRQVQLSQLDESRRQFNEQFGMDKSKFDQQQALNAGNLTGYYNGQNTLSRDELLEQQRQFNQKQAMDYYNRLSELASNPRNFVQSFFEQRGRVAPAGAGQYGNVAAFRGQQAQTLPYFGAPGGAPGAPVGQSYNVPGTNQQATMGPVTQSAPPMIAGGVAGADAQGNPISFNPQTRQINPTQNNAQNTFMGQTWNTTSYGTNAPRLVAAPGSGIAGTASVEDQLNAGGIVGPERERLLGLRSQAAEDRMNGTYYAKGGIIPEPVVGRGVTSGKPYVFGERGPEGVIPSEYLPDFLKRRNGTQHGRYYIGGEIGYGDEPYPDPYSDPYTPQPGFIGPINSEPQYDYTPDLGYIGPPSPYDNYDYSQDPGLIGSPPISDPVWNQPTTTAPAPWDQSNPLYTEQGALSQEEVNRLIAQQPGYIAPEQWNAPAPAPTPFTPTQPDILPAPSYDFGTTPAPIPAPFYGNQPTTAPAPNPAQYLPEFVSQPTALPQNGQTSPSTSGAVMPRDIAPQGTFGNTTGGQRPTFLPGEDNAGGNVLQQLLSAGALPPFLSRLLAQNQGVQSEGTNRPQAFNLPKDVPLVSKMAFLQMTPSEQQGLLSYVSSYGVTPEDYLAAIESYAPQGPRSTLPTFGQGFAYSRQ